jgi:hypothetical protein
MSYRPFVPRSSECRASAIISNNSQEHGFEKAAAYVKHRPISLLVSSTHQQAAERSRDKPRPLSQPAPLYIGILQSWNALAKLMPPSNNTSARVLLRTWPNDLGPDGRCGDRFVDAGV